VCSAQDTDAMTAQPSSAHAMPGHDTNRHDVRRADLPLSCPTPAMALWNSHPRVYLAIEAEGGESTCPYCGAQYVLID
jgi:uncharacterized Zn-finger protein